MDHEKVTFNESCASFKGYSADVPRYKRVLLTGKIISCLYYLVFHVIYVNDSS